jgi:phosphoribosylanthranilate isomerase
LTWIKICGVKDIYTAEAIAVAGADCIGLIFANSSRQVNREKASSITMALKLLENPPVIAGVFVNEELERLNSIADYCQLDMIQLSGNEEFDYIKKVKKPIINVIHVNPGNQLEAVRKEVESFSNISLKYKPLVMLDSRFDDRFGGSGLSFEWELAKVLSKTHRIIVAGGLNSVNVKTMIKEVKPYGVDVSSGVETGGHKDITKIKAFIRAVKDISC